MARNSMHIFEIPEHDLLILNDLFGECLAKSGQFFYFVLSPAQTGTAVLVSKLTRSLRSAAEQASGLGAV
jgi:hypothetical protein